MQAVELPLRDIHEPPAPPWWPPAPGWWIVLGVVLLLVLLFAAWRWRRAQRRRRLARLFDETVATAATPAQQVAAMSSLLRRAARTRDPHADTLDGDDWLRLLDDGLPQSPFVAGVGRLLLDGAYRADVDAGDVQALCVLARTRFLDWMGAR